MSTAVAAAPFGMALSNWLIWILMVVFIISYFVVIEAKRK